ncbi:hypothetical protein CASFOL_039909 [Castilleja foliolosa]|uniref:Uncharacterized protein n=1 Tax=Castilleja foliolosa TaxID=1961234 RepID=A0ABD3BH41_9LAMI
MVHQNALIRDPSVFSLNHPEGGLAQCIHLPFLILDLASTLPYVPQAISQNPHSRIAQLISKGVPLHPKFYELLNGLRVNGFAPDIAEVLPYKSCNFRVNEEMRISLHLALDATVAPKRSHDASALNSLVNWDGSIEDFPKKSSNSCWDIVVQGDKLYHVFLLSGQISINLLQVTHSISHCQIRGTVDVKRLPTPVITPKFYVPSPQDPADVLLQIFNMRENTFPELRVLILAGEHPFSDGVPINPMESGFSSLIPQEAFENFLNGLNSSSIDSQS